MMLIFNAFTIFAQDNNYGIYKTPEDYKNRKLSCQISATSPGKIKLHHLFSGRYVDVITNGKRCRYNKDSIYGYRNSKNEDFRFYKTYDKEYRILENNGVIIYLGSVKTSHYNDKHIQFGPAYFFSKTADSPVLPLTVLNLKRAFPDNLKFHDMLDMEFGNEQEINTENIFKINQLLNQSK